MTTSKRVPHYVSDLTPSPSPYAGEGRKNHFSPMLGEDGIGSNCAGEERHSPSSRNIGRLALESMLVEVSATPKPGLVDRNNSGAHRDMGFFTFLKSAASLRNTFDTFAQAGSDSHSPSSMFPALRKIGIEAEKYMFSATGGINTHKGEIFSLGVLSGCAGYLSHHGQDLTPENILSLAGVVCAGLCESDFAESSRKPRESLTKGERVYIDYGIAGIRGEAEAGYPVVKNSALPALSHYLSEGYMNDALAFTLIHIMAVNYDTNIISRHDLATAQEVMNTAKKLIADGLTLEKLHTLDAEFISRNISPSGSADLLAVTYFIYSLAHPSPNL